MASPIALTSAMKERARRRQRRRDRARGYCRNVVLVFGMLMTWTSFWKPNSAGFFPGRRGQWPNRAAMRPRALSDGDRFQCSCFWRRRSISVFPGIHRHADRHQLALGGADHERRRPITPMSTRPAIMASRVVLPLSKVWIVDVAAGLFEQVFRSGDHADRAPGRVLVAEIDRRLSHLRAGRLPRRQRRRR